MIDGDFSAGGFGSTIGEVEVEFSRFWFGVSVEATAKPAVLSVPLLSKDSIRNSSLRSAKQTKTKGRKTRLAPNIDRTLAQCELSSNLFSRHKLSREIKNPGPF